jgi:UDP-N-acetylglucosamine 2-epimerase (non-hydrolysing)
VAPAVKILSVLGTRPEVVKMAPVLHALARDPRAASRVCVTGQHRTMLDELLPVFAIKPDLDLAIMRAGQSPSDVLAAAVTGLQAALRQERPDWAVAEGDTTTVMATAIAAFHERVPFAHVEAGLRSHDFERPFPEEFNRRVADVGARWCFAPTAGARANLLGEGTVPERVLVTGNTVVDALLDVAARPERLTPGLERLAAGPRRLVLVTAHRRESFGEPLRELCLALREIAESHADGVQLVYPVHLNPNVRAPVGEILGGVPNVALVEPLDYVAFVHLMKRAWVILTDSGGIQEEAPSLGVPVLVMREVTERPEAVERGTARLVGTRRETIVAAARELLDDPAARQRMTGKGNPYGDGHAGARIAAALLGDPVTEFAG